ncbi:response regulator [Candidatus Aquiluna sp. UB-MaderosW2red]|uniref:response regulator n=1 Tax=Candidatus Aquiluna sp. UB-MaderosW2red TaxID=1855377 RepID=UPI001561A35E|nr:response regulator [Candidatus Aquiluna sp. UB-MaderosW2red]
MDQNFVRTVLLVDDEPIITTLLAERLDASGFKTFVAHDALSAKQIAQKNDPDAVVADLDLGEGPSGTELIAALAAINPAMGFVLLTNYTPTASELKSAPNLRYLSKREIHNINTVVEALDSVMSTGRQVTGEIKPSVLSKLTKGQLAVLALMARGLNNQEIALERKVGLRAVEQSVHRIYMALELHKNSGGSNRVAAARIYSLGMGLRGGKP